MKAISRTRRSLLALFAPWVLVIGTPATMVDTYAATTQSAAQRAELSDEAFHEVLPDAETFESEDGIYKHVRGYASNADGESELVGFAFLVKDLGARSRGYNGVIPILVGMDLRGRVTGIKIFKHFEPYGYRSINLPEYGAQFRGKSVLDAFKVGEDIDAYSGATITTVAATRAVRHASRRMAREFLVKKTKSQSESGKP
jgi:NosR/NirI family nitrous oxide reductase transcriptional regulator